MYRYMCLSQVQSSERDCCMCKQKPWRSCCRYPKNKTKKEGCCRLAVHMQCPGVVVDDDAHDMADRLATSGLAFIRSSWLAADDLTCCMSRQGRRSY